MPGTAGKTRWPWAVGDIAAHRQTAALLFDIDGTLAPIVDRPGDAAVPAPVRAGLSELAGSYLLVACVSGRGALEARELVGIEELTYVGLHGLETLAPGRSEPEVPAGAREAAAPIRELVAEHRDELRDAGVRVEPKEPIIALHWRGAEDANGAHDAALETAEHAVVEGLTVKAGRKVIEIRPDVEADKGTAVRALVIATGAERALYAGDDVTDVDAFRALGQMRVQRELRRVCRVAVASAEEPNDLRSRADVIVNGPEEIGVLIAALA